MEEVSAVRVMSGVCGVLLLWVGQRHPKWMSLGLGFGAGVWISHQLGGSGETSVGFALTVGLGVTGAVLVLLLRGLLPLVLGWLVGGALSFFGLSLLGGSAMLGDDLNLILAVVSGMVFLVLMMATRLVSMVERVGVAVAGSVMLCAAFERTHQIEWVVGIAVLALALDTLRRR